MITQFIHRLLLASAIIYTPVWAASPSSFNYAGQVNVKGAPFEGNGFFRFALVNFDCTEATTAIAENCKTLWSNDGSSTQGSEPAAAVELIVLNGKFNINIGDNNAVNRIALDPELLQDQPLYLRTWFDDGKNNSEQLKPDYELKSVPYALASKVSENGIGYNQSWSDVTNDHSFNGIFLNDSGRPIKIKVTVGSNNGDFVVGLFVGKVSPPDVPIGDIHGHGAQLNSTTSAIIPTDHFYQLKIIKGDTSKQNIISWSELR